MYPWEEDEFQEILKLSDVETLSFDLHQLRYTFFLKRGNSGVGVSLNDRSLVLFRL